MFTLGLKKQIRFQSIIYSCFIALFIGQASAGSGIDSLMQEMSEAQGIDKVELLGDIAIKYLDVDMDSAEFYGKNQVALADSLGNRNTQASAYNTLAIIYYKQGHFNEAIPYYIKAIELNKDLGNKEQLAHNFNNIGLAYYQIGDYEDALDYQLKALEIKKERNDSLKLSNAYNNIGMIYQALESYDISLKYYRKALELDQKNDNLNGIRGSLNNIGSIYSHKGKYNKARKFYQKAVAINNTNNTVVHNSELYDNLGITFLDQKRYDSAEFYFRKSLKSDLKRNKPKGQLETYFNLGRNFYQQNQLDSALYYLKKAENLGLKLGMKPRLVDIYEVLTDVYEESKQPARALNAYKEYASWKDSLWEKQNRESLQKEKAKFESENKKKEIELLRKKDELQKAKIEHQNLIITSFIVFVIVLAILIAVLVRIYLRRKNAYKKLEQQGQSLKEQQRAIEQQNEELKALNDDKNQFIRILAHDLRNPLNQVHGLAELVLNDDDKLDQEQKENLQYIKEASIHANNMISKLLDINAIENKGIQPKFKKVILEDLLEPLVNNYQNTARQKSIQFEKHFPENPSYLSTDPYFCRQIFDNLINNALKYSPQGTVISLSIYDKTDSLLVEIQDEGPGISEEDQDKLFQKFQKLSAKPTGNEPSTGLGLSIVKRYVESLNGEVWCESTLGNGTSFFVKLPKGVPENGAETTKHQVQSKTV